NLMEKDSPIPGRTGRALINNREKARLGLLTVFGRPKAILTHLDFTPLEPIPADHWKQAHIEYIDYIQDVRCQTKNPWPPNTSLHYSDLQFDQIEVDKVFPKKPASRKLRLRPPFTWDRNG